MTLEEIASRFQGARRLQRGGYEMLCPCHDDHRASLGIAIGENGGVVMHCLAGCANADILAAVGLSLRDLAPTTTNGDHPPETVYRYDDEHGGPLFEVVKTADKRFWQRLPGGVKGKIERRCLYRLPNLLGAVPPGAPIFIVEGEKDADNLWRHGLPATTNPMGAGKWRQEYTDWLVAYLPERRFIILPDNDEPGLNHADQVEHSLRNAGLSVQTRQLPGLPPKGDVSDWLATGGAVEELFESSLNSLNSLNSFQPENEIVPAWVQPLAEEAFWGTAGEVVRAMAPETEADSAALLISLLVAFGNLVGRGPHCRVGATRHHANLFAAVVGRTGEARKGTSYDPIEELLGRIAPEWTEEHILNGLSSGEGLILTVCDAIEKRVQVKDKKSGRMTMDFDTVVEREGVSDKRQLVVETELASLLKVMSRQGNTISPVLRVAWDGGRLQSVVKNNPMKATGSHISMIGHITPEELRHSLTEMEAANGFGNRILWLVSRRSKFLPEGGEMPALASEVYDLKRLVELAATRDLLRRDEDAKKVWAAIYEPLCAVQPGLAGTLCARGAAQVLRLSLVYALLDGLSVILVPHVLAALAVWDYCLQSVRLIFGDATGDPLADTLYETMRSQPESVTRTALHQTLGKNRLASELDTALTSLLKAGKIRQERVKGEGGRTVEAFTAVPAAQVPVRGGGLLALAKAEA